jgi:hypothetical protein
VCKDEEDQSLTMAIHLYVGVGYSTQNMARPNVIQHWPGKGQVENKVPTVLTYTSNNLTSWGFLCQTDDDYHPSKQTHQWFKLLLNPQFLEHLVTQPDAPRITHRDVKRWYLDFLQKLYQHIEKTMVNKVQRAVWMGDVEFIFSVPTTWTKQGMIEDYRAIINQAGFGSGGQGHEVILGLTEAEAAAVYTAKGSVNSFSVSYYDPPKGIIWPSARSNRLFLIRAYFQKGDTILICDAGGGTTVCLITFSKHLITSQKRLQPQLHRTLQFSKSRPRENPTN